MCRWQPADASSCAVTALLYGSIVGVDHLATWGYPKAKLQAERVVTGSGLPWAILRATQFYDPGSSSWRKICSDRTTPLDPR